MKKTKTAKDKVVMNLQMERGMKDALAKAAAIEDATSSQIVRRLIAEWLKAKVLK
jgi:bacterioferritin (cytochrome b1)